VINSSPGDLTPVFEAMLRKATTLCEASYGMLYRYDGDHFHAVALHAVPTAYAKFLREPIRADRRNGLGRLVSGERLVHLPHARADAAYLTGEPFRVATVELGGARTLIVVALRKDDVLLGAIVAYRQEVRPFSDKQTTLMENFAAQAVIAIDNARLITETREALEQQTATAEVLQVINGSPGDLTPVFDSILENAHTLCGAEFGSLFLYDGEHFRAIASHAVPEALVSRLREGIGANDSRASQQLIAGEPFAHIHDSALEEHAGVSRYGHGQQPPHPAVRPAAEGRRSTRNDCRRSIRGASVLGQADRAVAEFRDAGSHRNGERAAVGRDERGA
jgi:hypothetical protein